MTKAIAEAATTQISSLLSHITLINPFQVNLPPAPQLFLAEDIPRHDDEAGRFQTIVDLFRKAVALGQSFTVMHRG